MIEAAEGRLHRAGYPGGLRGADWMGVKVLSAICFGIGFTVLFLAISGFPLNVLFGIGGLAVGFLAPEFWLGRKIRQRSMDMTLQLPDALDLLTISVEAGLGFDALAKVVEKMEGPLITEFRQALAEIRMGRARRDALGTSPPGPMPSRSRTSSAPSSRPSSSACPSPRSSRSSPSSCGSSAGSAPRNKQPRHR